MEHYPVSFAIVVQEGLSDQHVYARRDFWYDVRAMVIVCTSPISILIGTALVISTFVGNVSAGFHTLILSPQIIFLAASSIMVLKLVPKSIRADSLLLYQI